MAVMGGTNRGQWSGGRVLIVVASLDPMLAPYGRRRIGRTGAR
jgi:hypothetical protein